MSRKKSQNASQYEAEEKDGEESQESSTVLPEEEQKEPQSIVLPQDNVFNIGPKVDKPNTDKQANNDHSTSIENHHKFSKFSKLKK